MMRISVVVITLNEQENIGRCIDSVQGVADEVLVVDSGSTDATYRIAVEKGARFVSHAWEGYSAQKNYANGLAAHPWILSLDADECLSDELRQSLIYIAAHDFSAETVFGMNRRTAYCGRFMRRIWARECKVRLFHKDMAVWDGDYVHEKLSYAATPNVLRLSGDLLHYSYASVDAQVKQLNEFSGLSAAEAFAAGRRYGLWAGVFKAQWLFFRDYVLKGGFLDGGDGFVVCCNNAFYAAWKGFKLWQKYKEEPLYAISRDPAELSAVYEGTFLIACGGTTAEVSRALPMVGCLKRKYPRCRVLFMAHAGVRQTVEAAGEADGFVDGDMLRRLSPLEAVEQMRSWRLRAAVSVQGDPVWAAWMKTAAVPLRIGDARERAVRPYLNRRVAVSRYPFRVPEICRNTLLLRPLGIVPVLVPSALSSSE
ncbi:MAG: glycosyltransferase family 2 protein [Bacteroidales bacterium]|nr:glycosyltransferase family 2 protein [Bacteroidales bacterium]